MPWSVVESQVPQQNSQGRHFPATKAPENDHNMRTRMKVVIRLYEPTKRITNYSLFLYSLILKHPLKQP